MILETRHSISEILSRQPLFRILSGPEQSQLAKSASEYRLSKNEMLLQKGEVSEGLHVVITGQVKMYLPSMAGSEKVVRMAAPGDTFGEEGVFLNKPCPMAIQAVRDSILLVLDKQALLDTMERNCVLSSALMTHMCTRLCELVENLETCVQRNSAQRVVHYLVQMAPRETESFDLTLDVNKQTIASQLNLAPETFSRVLGRLAKDGCIQVKGRNITVKNLSALREYAG
jgi:CRP/FNR family transcriptional regulator, dissimilatory nitrate respiration regulator